LKLAFALFMGSVFFLTVLFGVLIWLHTYKVQEKALKAKENQKAELERLKQEQLQNKD
jgi:heme exporter protein D